MHTQPSTIALDAPRSGRRFQTGYFTSLLRSALLSRLAKIEKGGVTLHEGSRMYFYGDSTHPLQTTLHVRDARFYAAATLGGSTGAGEAYMQGWWDADNIPALFRIFLKNRDQLAGLEKSLGWLTGVKDKLWDMSRANTLSGSKKNILAHYDLSNDFYRLWLDPTMTYSSGVFPYEGASMEEASVEKLDRICRKLDLQPGDHVLEIGTGWGGFALHAASKYGVKVTTTTISDEQYTLAVRRVREAGLEDRITLLNQDYRSLEGQYDKLVSIEMIEAVGHKFIPEYVRTLNRLVKPGGKVAIQGITINDRHYDRYRKSVDFIKKYIFPGGNLVSMDYLFRTMKAESTFQVIDTSEIGLHYAETLRRWRDSFESVLDDVRELGFNERFIRMWRFYLTYCEAGFMEKHIGAKQLVFEKA